jgi:glycosyltransferase involved in cell wall biosynthesis
MRKNTKIIFISGNTDSVSYRFRVVHIANTLDKNGYPTEQYDLNDITDRFSLQECEMLVIFRAEWNHHLERLVHDCRKKNIPVVFDIDDLIFDVNVLLEGHWAYYGYISENDQSVWYQKVVGYRKTMEQCDAAILSTAPLQTAAATLCRRTYLLPNTLDDQLMQSAKHASEREKPSKSDGKIRIGFASGTPTHKKDFEVAVAGISQILQENPHVTLTIIGALDPVNYPELRDYFGQIEKRPLVDITSLASEIHRFDINLAPLESDNPFCESKSALRCIMASAVGTPSIVSPTQPLREAVGNGKYGLIARNDKEWYQCIHTLVSNMALRKKFGAESNAFTLRNFGPEAGESLSQLIFRDIIRDYRSGKSGFLSRILRGIIQ